MSPEEQRKDLDTKIPHDHEHVSREFDKTPLSEAVTQYHTDDEGNIIVPDTLNFTYPDGSHPESNYQPKSTLEDTSEKKSGNWWTRKKVAAVIAGAAVLGVGGAGAGIYAANQPSHSSTDTGHDNPNTNKSGDKDTETKPESLLTGEALTQSFEIKSGLDPQELGATVTKRLNSWLMYGAVDKTEEKWQSEGEDAYVQQLTGEAGDSIAKGLFIDGYETNANLKAEVDRMKEHNAGNVEMWVRTDPAIFPLVNKERYQVNISTDSVTVTDQTPDSISLKIISIEHINLHNGAAIEPNGSNGGLKRPDDPKDGQRIETNITLQDVDGLAKISQITAVDIG